MASAAKQSFLEGVEGVTVLHATRSREASEDAAWKKLQRGIKAAKADIEMLSGHPPEIMHEVLEFFLEWAKKNTRMRKGPVAECLNILLGNQQWHASLMARNGLRSSMQSFFDGDAVLMEKLEGRPSLEAHGMTGVAEDVLEPEEVTQAKEKLLAGIKTMEAHSWSYPSLSATVADDSVGPGFDQFIRGINQLSVLASRQDQENKEKACITRLVAELKHVWPDVVRFLADMCQKRSRMHRSRVESVVAKLAALSPGFKDAAEQGGLLRPDVEESASSPEKATAEAAAAEPAELAAEPEPAAEEAAHTNWPFAEVLLQSRDAAAAAEEDRLFAEMLQALEDEEQCQEAAYSVATPTRRHQIETDADYAIQLYFEHEANQQQAQPGLLARLVQRWR